MPVRMTESTHGEKLIQLFNKLLFSGRSSFTLSELSKELGCSKQTVIRLMDTISEKLSIDTLFDESHRRVYQIERGELSHFHGAPISLEDLTVLEMCRAFTENLLGKQEFEKATESLRSARLLMPKAEKRNPPSEGLGCFTPGAIDYSKHRETIFSLMEALRENRVCRLQYGKAGTEKRDFFDVMPLKLFSFRDTIYLHARLYLEGKKPRPGTFDPLLAVHRIRELKLRKKTFTPPSDYDFDQAFKQSFGLVKKEPFRLRVVFTDWAATYARERTWSPDQEVAERPGGAVEISFTASSDWEASSWVLSFRGQAQALEPKWLVEQVRQEAEALCRLHV